MSRSVCAFAVAFLMSGSAVVSAQATTTPTTTTIAILAAKAPVSSVGAGTSVTLSATVVSGTATRTVGQVNFCDADAKFCTDIHLLATSQITAAGTATYTFRTGVGTHHYKAVYLGTKSDASSASAPATLIVTASAPPNSPTTTVLVATGHPGDYTLTATVNSKFQLPPTGAVSFFDITNNNYTLGTATVSPGLGSVSLQLGTSLGPGGVPVIADFNDDGILDIAQGGTVYLGKGDGTFNAVPGIVGGNLSADFNDDGKPDLASAGNPGSISLGNGDGTFTPAPNAAFSGDVIVAGDINHDGIEDIVASNGSTISTYFGRGDGTFTPAVQVTIVTASSMYLGDFNNDGNLDLAITNPMDPRVTILLGKGDGSFIQGVDIDVDGTLSLLATATVVIADFNNDGNADLVVADTFEPNSIFLLLGAGDGTFAKPIKIDTYYFDFFAAADFNDDGVADLALIYQYPFSSEDPDIVIEYGNGDGTFRDGPVITDPGDPTAVYVADFNGDGYPDIAAVESGGALSLYLTQFTATSTAVIDNINVVGTGTHYADAQYTGKEPYLGSLSPPIPLTADTVPTTLALTAAPAAGITVGQSATISASLSPFTAQDHDATGLVTFSSNGIMLGTGMVSGGVATLTTTALTAGSDDLVATYPGDENFRPSTARDLIYPVEPLKAQTINFPQPGSPVSVNAPPITLVATASSGLPVTFKLVSGPATLTGSVLTLTGLGTIVVAADQPGNSIYAAAPEVTRSILVTPPATVTLVASAPLVFLLNPVTLTATISPSGSTATGTVTFFDGTQTIGTAPPQGGIATISVSSLPVGPHNITAVWSGDAGYAAATSVPSALTVEDFFVAFADAQITIIHGGTATLSLQLTPVGGPATAGPITVSLSGEPTGSEMTVTPTSIATGASSGTVTVVIATPNYPTGPFALNSVGRSRSVLALIAFGGLLLPFARRRKHLRSLWGSALLAIISMALLVGAIGCGSGWSTEVFQIQATATSGALSHTATATLTSKCSNGQPACPVISQ